MTRCVCKIVKSGNYRYVINSALLLEVNPSVMVGVEFQLLPKDGGDLKFRYINDRPVHRGSTEGLVGD